MNPLYDSPRHKVAAVIEVSLHDAPVLDASYLNQKLVPYLLRVEYRYERGEAGTWTTHWWQAVKVEVAGHRVLKPGPDGSLRVSATQTHKCAWYGADISESLPEWLDEIVSELRPSGEVQVLGLA